MKIPKRRLHSQSATRISLARYIQEYTQEIEELTTADFKALVYAHQVLSGIIKSHEESELLREFRELKEAFNAKLKE